LPDYSSHLSSSHFLLDIPPTEQAICVPKVLSPDRFTDVFMGVKGAAALDIVLQYMTNVSGRKYQAANKRVVQRMAVSNVTRS
jgi:hypothetical protein